MKKLLLSLVIFAVLLLSGIYFLFPTTATVESLIKLPCTPDAAFRILSKDREWTKWWPSSPSPDSTYSYAGKKYTVFDLGINSIGINIKDSKDSITTQMHLLSLPGDSMLLRWHAEMRAPNTPFGRIASYQRAGAVKASLDSILGHLQKYLSDFRNVYGINVREGSITDTFLITTKALTPTRPSTVFVYQLVSRLKKYCEGGTCIISGVPMLNVTPIADSGYQVMVALPVNKFVAGKGDITGVKMVPGKFLISEVTGGPATLNKTHEQLLYYFRDYHRTAMAIPFEYLITDRLNEPDSNKWHTIIYSPVY